MIKRYIGMLMVLCFFISCFTVYANFSDIDSSDYKSDIMQLNAIGIIDGFEDGSFKPKDGLTRAEFAKLIVSLNNLELTGYDTEVYPDVKKSYWAFNEIMYSATNGFMRGYEDGTFKPEYFITTTESLVVLVNVLGYKYKALSQGGYPSGYELCANQIGLTKGVKLGYEKKLTREAACKLINNALDIPLVEFSKIGSEQTYKISEDKTILSEYFKLKRGKGVVTANDLISLSGSAAPEDTIKIDDKLFYVLSQENRNLVGLTVSYIYDIEDKSDISRLIYIGKESDNKELTINVDNYLGFENGYISYEDSGNNVSKISISQLSDVFYNGQAVDLSGGLKNLLDSVVSGNIRLISSNKNNVYDIIFINEYENLTIGRINKTDEIIIDKDDPSFTIDLSTDNKKVILKDEDGSDITIEDLYEMDIITASINTHYIEAYRTNKVVSGQINEKYYENNGTYLIIGENKIKLDSSVSEKYNNYMMGISVRSYLNYFGEIAYMEKLINSDFVAMYLIKTGVVSKDLDNTIVGKFYDPISGICNLNFAKKFKINGRTTQENLSLNDLNDELTGYNKMNNKLQQMVLLQLNENQEITSLETAKLKTDLLNSNDDGFCQMYPLGTRTFLADPKCFNYKIYAHQSDVSIIIVPNNSETASDKDYQTVDNSFLVNGVEYNVTSFNYSKNDLRDELILIISDDSLSGTIDEYTYIATVTGKSKALNNEDMPVDRIKVNDGLTESYFDVDPDKDVVFKFNYTYTDEESHPVTVELTYRPQDLDVGDIIRYTVNKDKYIQILEVNYDYSNDYFFDTLKKELIGNNLIRRTVKAIDNSWIAVLHGIYSLNEYDYIKFPLNSPNLKGKIVIVENRNGNILIRKGGVADIEVEDDIFIQVIGNRLGSIVVYK